MREIVSGEKESSVYLELRLRFIFCLRRATLQETSARATPEPPSQHQTQYLRSAFLRGRKSANPLHARSPASSLMVQKSSPLQTTSNLLNIRDGTEVKPDTLDGLYLYTAEERQGVVQTSL
jgi:hypothetical protein